MEVKYYKTLRSQESGVRSQNARLLPEEENRKQKRGFNMHQNHAILTPDSWLLFYPFAFFTASISSGTT